MHAIKPSYLVYELFIKTQVTFGNVVFERIRSSVELKKKFTNFEFPTINMIFLKLLLKLSDNHAVAVLGNTI